MSAQIFALALGLSSFLLFLLEPMVAKSLLPRLGGAPMVWNTCVFFFQSTLLAGYAFAHFVAGATRRGALLLIALAAAAVATLPIALQELIPTGSPALWLVSELTRSVGPVFFVLSACAPSLQAWFSKLGVHRSEDPYFLYAASNAGSFAALLAYPAIVEPTFTLGTQSVAWEFGYVIFVVLMAICFWTVRRWQPVNETARSVDQETLLSPEAARRQRLIWFALAFIPSSLMLGVTTYISTDVAAVPLVWVGPLALYLLTFVLTFGRSSGSLTAGALRRMPLLLSAVIFLMTSSVLLPITYNLVLHMATFFVVAIAAHGTLAARRPAVPRLTEFYLIISAGGVAAGLFNVLIAPLIFTGPTEYPLMLVAAAAIPIVIRAERERGSLVVDLTGAALVASAAGLAGVLFDRDGTYGRIPVVVIGLLTLLVFSQSRRPRRFALLMGGILLATLVIPTQYGQVLSAERTFFGTYRVAVAADGRYRELYHGTTLHGMQSTEPARANEPLTYFHRLGPFGEAHQAVPVMANTGAVAVIGLGVGSLAAYAGTSQQWTFFEIDPAVERIARDERYFSFLSRCGGRCQVVIGDARLSLRQARDQQYGVLVMDAFSSDAIPVHLLTTEAFAEYLTHLAPGGVLMVHISNRYLSLRPVLAGLAQSHALTAFDQLQRVGGATRFTPEGRADSHWVAMSKDPAALQGLVGRPQWNRVVGTVAPVVWTDEYSNILSVLGRSGQQ